MVVWPHALGWSIMAAGVCDGEGSSPPGRQEAEGRQEGAREGALRRHH
jgi:hypothetical protein